MTRAAIGLGSNLGDREQLLLRAMGLVAELGSSAESSFIYETEPIGGPSQPPYLNAVMVIETELNPQDLHARLLGIEREMGRERGEKWGPRNIDLDLLLFGETAIETDDLTVPHPRMLERRFVLEPLAEVWPDAPLARGISLEVALAGVADQRIELHENLEQIRTRWGPRLGFTARGGWWVVAQVALFGAIIAAILLLDEIPGTFGPGSVVVGAVLLVAAGILSLGGAWVLGGVVSPYPAPLPGGRFVDRGVYRLVRHPIYGGAILGFCGLSLVRSSLPGLLLGLSLIPFFWAKSTFEERLLTVRYAAYGAYRARVRRRLIPWIM